MDREGLAVVAGGVATGALVVLAALPYALFRSSAVSVYYGVGVLGPQWLALFGIVATLALVAGARDRTDPPQAAGIAVTLAAFALLLSIVWALPARPVAAGFVVDPVFGYHPHAVAASALVLLVTSGAYAWLVVGPDGR